jgi:glycerate dehydrogenase
MRITVLDGYTLNPGDLSWEPLKELGDLEVYDRTEPEKVLQRARDSEIVLTNKTPLTAGMIANLEKLRFIGVLATGYNVVDGAAARERDIPVSNVPTYGTASVAQMVFALLLELTNHAALHSDSVCAGDWTESRDFCYWKTPLVELAGKTMGIYGFGRIGTAVGRIADAFGMKVRAYDAGQRKVEGFGDFSWLDEEELFSSSDVISLHCPLFPETEGLINKETLAKCKPESFLINTSRGGLVVDADLASALNGGVIAGAGLDVLSIEPPKQDNPLLYAKNCLITPHIAWASRESRSRLLDQTVKNLRAFLEGAPVHVVN